VLADPGPDSSPSLVGVLANGDEVVYISAPSSGCKAPGLIYREESMSIRWSAWSKGLVLGTVMLLVLAACGGDDPTATPTNAPPTATLAPGEPTPTAVPTPAFDADAYFAGKTIRIVANSNPGGGTDAQGRVMSAYISKWLPGKPRIIFQNQGNKPLAYVYAAEKAPKDGSYIAWDSTPQLDFGFNENGNFNKRSTFEFIGSTIDATRSFTVYDPPGNLGAAASDKCLWDFGTAGNPLANTGEGRHGAFILGEEISDIAEGAPNFLATSYALEQLGAPFEYYAFDVIDTNVVLTKWQQHEINTTVRNSLWYRIPQEYPEWLDDDPTKSLMRVYANMGPGTLGPNAWGEPQCGYIGDHLPTDEALNTFKAIMNPTNYMSKSLWLPPGTPDEIADAMSAGLERAFTEDTQMLQKYGAIAGEVPSFKGRDEGMALTLENEIIFGASQDLVQSQKNRLLEKYFSEYIN
jgi:hypothetical protein